MSWGTLVAVLFTVLGAFLVARRLRAELTRDELLMTARFFGLTVSAWSVGSLIKGLNLTAFITVVGMAAWILLIGTWGHPAVLYKEWLRREFLPRRRRVFFYVRLFSVAVVAALVATPFVQRHGH